MSDRSLEMSDDDIAFALGQCVLNLEDKNQIPALTEMARQLRTYNGIHKRMFCACDVAFSRGYFFKEERSMIREYLDEMDALPDQIEVRTTAPRVPVKHESDFFRYGSVDQNHDQQSGVQRSRDDAVGSVGHVSVVSEDVLCEVVPDIFPPPGMFCLD